MGIVLLIYCLIQLRLNNYHEKKYYNQLIKLGLPISAAILVEFVAFNIVAIAMGRVAGKFAAAQNMICTLTTISFMIPFAISNAIAVKVGFANGAENYFDLKRFAKIGTEICLGFMIFSAIIFSSFPHRIVSIFTNDPELIQICVPIMYILSCFQIFDGLQIALAGICKGLKKSKIVLIANFIAYWLISIPLGYTLAFKFNLGIKGFWIGLVGASIVLCIIMFGMLKRYFKKIHIS
jgi:MATE family multidrug resistance protein